MTDDVPAIVATAISVWETSTGFTFIRAFPSDWNPEVLYAEWTEIRKRRAELCTGFSTTRDTVGPLAELLRNIEQVHGVVIDHIYAKRAEGHISVLWHLPGGQVRKFGWAPVAAAAAPVHQVQNSEKGVA